MRRRPDLRAKLRDTMLDQEEGLHDLRAALAALAVMASAPDGIETGDMAGLRFVVRSARELAGSLHHAWREALDHLGPRGEREGKRSTGALEGVPPEARS